MEAEITMTYPNTKIAKAIAEAVSPDNFKTPSGLSIKTASKETQVVTLIKSRRRLSTLISTIDDLLFCISIAEKTIQATNSREESSYTKLNRKTK